jgi:hypothetical protein
MPATFIHVGFSNTGTTSLQRNFFGKRDDIFFVGEPYHERGGIFFNIKTVEDFTFPLAHIEQLCQEQIYSPSADRAIVISDETLCDAPQLYFPPFVMPRDTVAQRLKHFFPEAKIIFTIRDQRECIASMYLNMKRNHARFARMPILPFEEWLAGMRSQPNNSYLRNLNFRETIVLYATLFGRENICVLPLELLAKDGPRAYLGKLCDFMGVGLTDSDVDNYAAAQNRRMTVRRSLVSELSIDRRFSELFAALVERFGLQQVDGFIDDGSPVSVAMERHDEEDLGRRVGVGNRLLDLDFGLGLERYGYLVEDDGAAKLADIGLGAGLPGFSRYVDLLQTWSDRKRAAVELRKREADNATLRSRVAELEARCAAGDDRGARLKNELGRVTDRAALLQDECDRVMAELTAIRQSTSWRITGPLRRLGIFRDEGAGRSSSQHQW